MKKLINGICSFFSNRARDIYRSKFVIEHAKAKYVAAKENIISMKTNIVEAKANIKVLEGRKAEVQKEIEQTKNELKSMAGDKIDVIKFNRLKSRLVAKESQLEFIDKSLNSYQTIADKLTGSIAKAEAVCEQLSYKIESLTQKQQIIQNIGSLNGAIVAADPDMADDQLETDEIDQAAAKEIAKMEVLSEDDQTAVTLTDQAEMKAFIDNL